MRLRSQYNNNNNNNCDTSMALISLQIRPLSSNKQSFRVIINGSDRSHYRSMEPPKMYGEKAVSNTSVLLIL